MVGSIYTDICTAPSSNPSWGTEACLTGGSLLSPDASSEIEYKLLPIYHHDVLWCALNPAYILSLWFLN